MNDKDLDLEKKRIVKEILGLMKGIKKVVGKGGSTELSPCQTTTKEMSKDGVI